MTSVLPSQTCPHCLLRTDLCICVLAPSLSLRPPASDSQWLLLTHEREIDKRSNTGRLLLNSLAGAQRHIWQRKVPLAPLLAGRRALLVFPEAETGALAHTSFNSAHAALQAAEVKEEGEQATSQKSTPITWVLLDSTWQQAQKMLRQSAELQALPRLSLKLDQPSRYQLRRNQQGFSTLETGVAILQQLGEDAAAEALLQYLEQFQQRWEAHRSAHPLSMTH